MPIPSLDRDGLDDDEIREILSTTRRIALVGASAKPERPAFGVMQFLLRHGFAVTPVNPGLAGQQIHGQTVVGALEHAAPIEMVDVFRAAEHAGAIVEAAIRLQARTVWMQLGVIDAAAAASGRAAGLRVVMDRCPKLEWARLGLGS